MEKNYQYQLNWKYLNSSEAEITDLVSALANLLMIMDIRIDEKRYNRLADEVKIYFKSVE